MTDITIDSSKCRGCGTCVEACAVGVLCARDKAPPTTNPVTESYCINCGHCEAICPTSALSRLSNGPLQEAIRPTDAVRAHVEATIRGRRSVREYADRPVDNETIERLIDSARYAPTAGNAQSVRWLVVNGSERVHKIAEQTIRWAEHAATASPSSPQGAFYQSLGAAWAAGLDPICRGAPCLVATYAASGAMMGATDSTLAIGYFDLLAHSAGLGTCWAGFVILALDGWQPLRDALGLAAGQSITGMLMLGHPKYKYVRVPERNPATITWLS